MACEAMIKRSILAQQCVYTDSCNAPIYPPIMLVIEDR